MIVRLFARSPQIDAADLVARLAEKSIVVVDVRQPVEWAAGHIRGAVHIPLAQVSSRLHELPAGSTLATVCRSGHRSALAARTLAGAGHDVLNLRGGLNAWGRAGHPLETSTRKR